MNTYFIAICCFFYFFLIPSRLQAQHVKNSKSFKYADSCYARSIAVKDSFAYTANSNGKIYRTNLNTSFSDILTGRQSFKELRDCHIQDNNIIALQSNPNNGVLIMASDLGCVRCSNPLVNLLNVFLDGMDIKNGFGFMMGDPVKMNDDTTKMKFVLLNTDNGGSNWKIINTVLEAYEGEAAFAASGTNVQVLNDSTYCFVSGGLKSRFFKSTDKGKTWIYATLRYPSAPSCGANSVYMFDEKNGVIVGGDYLQPDKNETICFYTIDGGLSWNSSKNQPRGYRSCVIEVNSILYTCGDNGIDYSDDLGKTWKSFADGRFFSLCSDGLYIYATCPKGRFELFNVIAPKD